MLKTNKLQLINKNGIFYADSRQVAEMIGKRHTDLLRDIDKYIDILGQNANLRFDNFFIKSSYKAGTGKSYSCYLLTRKGCDMVANKMTGEKGILFTAEYVTRFEEMEKQLQANLPNFNDPVAMARAWADEMEQKQKALTKLKEAQPKLSYYDEVLNSKGTMTTTQIASDYGLSAIKLNQILHKVGFIHKVGREWVLYAKHMQKGYTDNNTFTFTTKNGEVARKSLVWTQKGRQKIHEILEELNISPKG